MRPRLIALKITAIAVTISMGAVFIWWRHGVYDAWHRETYPWMYPENHERILAEALHYGAAKETVDENGKTAYLMAGSKFGWVIKREDIDYSSLWRDLQWFKEDQD